MGQVIAIDDLKVRASDVTGQRTKRVRVSPETLVNEWIEDLIAGLGLRRKDRDGNPYAYRARLDREGRHLHGSEIVGEVLQEDDHVILQPNIDAG